MSTYTTPLTNTANGIVGDSTRVANMDGKADLRMRGTTALDLPDMSGTIHPFLTSNRSILKTFMKEFACVLAEKQAKKILVCLCMNFLCTVVLLLWCNSTNSMALTAYTYLTIFDIFRLLTCLVSVWVSKQSPTPIFSFGYGRFEVLAVFASTLLAQLGSLFILKESVERMLQQPEIHTGRLLVGTTLAFMFHMVVTYCLDARAFSYVMAASSSSWLQEHVADMSESLCHVIPGLSKLLLPRINPFALIAFAGGLALMVVYILIDVNNYYSADTWAAVWIAIMTCGTMFPMCVYSGKILLQTTPSHIIGQLDKSIREASTLDGVLEFRNEHFWILAFGTMAGSVHVRIRRDADEQMVLAHVANRLSNIVSILTVQIFKDDWTRSTTYQILGNSALMSNIPNSGPSTIRHPALPDGAAYSHTPYKPVNFPQASLPYPQLATEVDSSISKAATPVSNLSFQAALLNAGRTSTPSYVTPAMTSSNPPSSPYVSSFPSTPVGFSSIPSGISSSKTIGAAQSKTKTFMPADTNKEH